MSNVISPIKLHLTKYKDTESNSYLYFWTELKDDTHVHISPMFYTVESANIWLNQITQSSKNVIKGILGK